jgi:TM2 domain-containing membrane protein YozV
MADFDFDEDDERAARPSASTKYCVECGEKIRLRAAVCPKCGVEQPALDEYDSRRSSNRRDSEASGNKIAAGICGILLGSLGIHKFIIGRTVPGIIMLLVTVITCGFGGIVMGIIGLIEGIIYLSKSDRDFYRIYVRGERGWF